MDKIRMTEEQAREMLKSLGGYNIDINMDYGIEKLTQAGYIPRPAWEEAEEMHQEFSKCEVEYISGSAIAKYIETALETIAALKKSHDALKEKAGIK